MEFIKFYANSNDDSENGKDVIEKSKTNDRDFIYNIEIDQNPSD